MSALGPHGGYILAAYLAAAIILGAMIIISLVEHRAAARRLAAIDAAGPGATPRAGG